MKKYFIIFSFSLLMFLLLPSNVFADTSYNTDCAYIQGNFGDQNNCLNQWDFDTSGQNNRVNIIQLFSYSSFPIYEGETLTLSFTLYEMNTYNPTSDKWIPEAPVVYGTSADYIRILSTEVVDLSTYSYGNSGGDESNQNVFLFIVKMQAKSNFVFNDVRLRMNMYFGSYYNHTYAHLYMRGFIYQGSLTYQEQMIRDIKNSLSNQSSSLNNIASSSSHIDSSINDSSGNSNTDNANAIQGFENQVASNNTISSLITMPITLYQKILNSVNGSCSTFTLGNLLGTNVSFQCINPATYLGSSLWSIIDVICAGLLVFAISKRFIKIFDGFTSMSTTKDEVGD